MAHEALMARIREMAESLRERAEGAEAESLLQRVEAAMAQSEEAAGALKPVDSGFLHLPEGAAQAEETARLREERDMLRQNLLALQQERDTMRQRVHELEDKLREAVLLAASQSWETPAQSGIALMEVEAHDPSGHKKRMGEILVDAGVIPAEQLQQLLAEQGDSRRKRIGALLVERGITSEEVIAKILAAQLKLPYVDLNAFQIVEAAALQIPEEFARRYECIAIDGDLAQITLAMANPIDLLAIENIEIAAKRRVFPAVAVPSAIQAAIENIYSAVRS